MTVIKNRMSISSCLLIKVQGTLIRFFIIAILLMATTSTTTGQPNQKKIDRNGALVIAHRGASGTAPENTLPAIREALDMGADIIEIDVHLSQDGQVIVIHDHRLQRTTNGRGLVRMTSLREIKDLDAGSWFDSSYASTKVPTLDEVLQTVDGQAKLLIEIKKGEKFYDDIERTILSLIARYNAEEWCILQAFQDRILQNLDALDPKMPVHKLIVGPVPLSPFLYDGKLKLGGIRKYQHVDGINLKKGYVDNATIQKIHNQGQTTYVWTVNEPDMMQKLVKLGVDGIITNHPEYFRDEKEGPGK